jgi:hypothetical protein
MLKADLAVAGCRRAVKNGGCLYTLIPGTGRAGIFSFH